MDSDIDYVREPHNLSFGDAVEVYKRDTPAQKYNGFVYRILTKNVNYGNDDSDDDDNIKNSDILIDYIYVQFPNETYNDILKRGSSVFMNDKICVLGDIVRNDETGQIEQLFIQNMNSDPLITDEAYTLNNIYGVLIWRRAYNIVLVEQSDETNDTDIVPEPKPLLRKRPMTRGYARQLYLEANPPVDSVDSVDSDDDDYDDDDEKYDIKKMIFAKMESIVAKTENSEFIILLCLSMLISILLPAFCSIVLNQTDDGNNYEEFQSNSFMSIPSTPELSRIPSTMLHMSAEFSRTVQYPTNIQQYKMNQENLFCKM